MRKIFALLISLIYLTANAGFAFSELYYLKNTTENTVKPMVLNAVASQNYKVMKENPYYVVSQKDSQDYAVIILQQSGQNMFYYYQSNDNKRINTNILKAVKNSKITYEQSFNYNILNIYDNLAKNTVSSNTANRYTFEENESPVYLSTKTANNTVQTNNSNNTLSGYVAQLDSGTKMQAYLQTAINTSSAEKGDRIVAVLTDDLRYNGYVVAPQGTVVYGTLTKARHATYGSRNGRVVIEFTQMVTPDNRTYEISAEQIDFTVTNDGKISSAVSNAFVGAAVGALTGLLFAAIGGSGNYGTSAAIGAGVGAGGALIGSTAERGVDAEIPSFTEMEITLTRPLRATVGY